MQMSMEAKDLVNEFAPTFALASTNNSRGQLRVEEGDTLQVQPAKILFHSMLGLECGVHVRQPGLT
jgi:hypothetical protein